MKANIIRLLRVLTLPSLLLLTLVLLFAAYQHINMMKVSVGPRDTRFIHNTHALEPLEDTGRLMRWTKPDTRIDLPLIAAHTPTILSINVMNHYPIDMTAPPQVDLLVDDQLFLHFSPHRESRHYRMLLPPHDRPGWSVPLALRSTTFEPTTDPRPLGVVLVEAKLTPTGGAPPLPVLWEAAQWLGISQSFPLLPPWWQIAAFVIGCTATYVAAWGMGAPRWLAWLLTAGLVGAMIAALVKLPMEIAPFTMRVAGLCVLVALYALAVVALMERLMVNDHARPWVPFFKIPLLMGAAYWLMPVYQLVMTADGVRHVTPYPPTMWIAAAGIVSSAIGLVVLADSGSLKHWPRLALVVLALAAVARLVVTLEFVMDKSGVAVICVGAGLLFVALSAPLRSFWRVLIIPLGIATVAGVVLAATQFDPWQGRSGPDFWILFRGARDWFRGGSLYNLVAVQENHFGHVFKVPPFYGMLFVPFAQQDGLTILFWHRIINMLLLALTLLVMLRGFGVGLFSALGVGVLMSFSMRAVADTVAFGQIDIVLLLLLTLALVVSRRGTALADVVAGAAVALGTLFKLYPVLLLAFFLARRQWWALAGFALAMLLCNGVALGVMGWEMHRVYLFEVVPRIGGGTAWVENQTLNGFLSRIYSHTITSTIYTHPVATMATYIVAAVAGLGAMLLALLPAERASARYALHFSIFPILMVLVVPAAWMHYQTIVILAFVAVLLYAHESGGLPRWSAALFGGAYGLLAYGNQWSFYLNKIMGGLTVMGVSYKFYGMILLLLVVVVCVFKAAPAPPQTKGNLKGTASAPPPTLHGQCEAST
jgi:hypothetical protein